MSVWLTMILCGLMTFIIRLSFIAAEGKVAFPPGFRRLLPFVPVANREWGPIAGDHSGGVLSRCGAVESEAAVCGNGGGSAGLAALCADLRVSSGRFERLPG